MGKKKRRREEATGDRSRERNEFGYLLRQGLVLEMSVFGFHSFHILLEVLDVLSCSKPAFTEGETVGFGVVLARGGALASGLRMVESRSVSAAIMVTHFLGRVPGDGVPKFDLLTEEHLHGNKRNVGKGCSRMVHSTT